MNQNTENVKDFEHCRIEKKKKFFERLSDKFAKKKNNSAHTSAHGYTNKTHLSEDGLLPCGEQDRRLEEHTSTTITQLKFPAPPELILEHHRKFPFLTPTEEWMIIELNEYECLVDGLEVIRKAAEHSKFFEVDPFELWQEFFEFGTDCCSFDNVINEDVWEEFNDKKYSL